MRVISWVVVAVWVVMLTGVAGADPPATIGGRVVDRDGAPVEGVNVYVTGAKGEVRTAITDRDGRYRVAVEPGRYHVVFVRGKARSGGKVEVDAGHTARLDGTIDRAVDEVIVIEEPAPPKLLPKLKGWTRRQPPYSDRAILEDAWTRAWLLLDVDERGVVTRFKFLQKPGYDLEPIAEREAFALRFDPARDDRGRPTRVWIVWQLEWPAHSWLILAYGVATRAPRKIGFPPRTAPLGVPCKGSGPWRMGSMWKGYRDCSTPDVTKHDRLPWVLPKVRGRRSPPASSRLDASRLRPPAQRRIG